MELVYVWLPSRIILSKQETAGSYILFLLRTIETHFSNATNPSIREETSSLTVAFAVSICRIVVLLSFSSQRNRFVALATYFRFAYCCQHRTNLRTSAHFRFIVLFNVCNRNFPNAMYFCQFRYTVK